ncbi:MAG: hypothetical protein IJZ73_05545 [Clostridia bacterium]|nr:hypothetical protein [Clostridia bacterium]
MNKKQIKNLLQQKAEKTQVKDCTNEILSKTHHTAVHGDVAVQNSGGAGAIALKRKPWLYMVCVALVLAITVAVIPWSTIFGKTPSGLAVGETEQVMSKEMIALGNLITTTADSQARFFSNDGEDGEGGGGGNGGENPNPPAPIGNGFLTGRDDLVKEINHYLLTGNALVEQDNIQLQLVENTDENYLEYKYKLTASYKDGKEYGISYVAYYNTVEESEEEVEIAGIIIIDETPYQFECEKETDGEEVELELKLITGENSYIIASNEIDTEETEFTITFYAFDIALNGATIEVETDGEDKKVTITVEDYIFSVSRTYKFFFRDEVIDCEYGFELPGFENENRFSIHVHKDKYTYLFGDSHSIDHDKIPGRRK